MGLNSSNYRGIENSERTTRAKQTRAFSLTSVYREVVDEYYTYYRYIGTLGGKRAISRQGTFHKYGSMTLYYRL